MNKLLPSIAFIVLAIAAQAQNKKPVITGNPSKQACVGQQVCFQLSTSDADNDTVTISWDHGIAPGIFSNNNHAVRFASGSVCWVPVKTDVSDSPYHFTVYATDKTDTVSRQFTVVVRPIPNAKPVITKSWCNNFAIQLKQDTGVKLAGLSLSIVIKDAAAKTVGFSTNLGDTLKLPGGRGMYVVYLTASTATPCVVSHADTLYTFKGVDAQIAADKNLSVPVKEWSELNLSAIISDSNGYSSFQYLWKPDGQTTPSIKVYPDKNTPYQLYVTTPDGCQSLALANVNVLLTGIDNIAAQKIKIYPNPATEAISIENTDEAIAAAELWNTLGQKITVLEILGKTTVMPVSELKPGNYFLVFTDKAGNVLASKPFIRQ